MVIAISLMYALIIGCSWLSQYDNTVSHKFFWKLSRLERIYRENYDLLRENPGLLNQHYKMKSNPSYFLRQIVFLIDNSDGTIICEVLNRGTNDIVLISTEYSKFFGGQVIYQRARFVSSNNNEITVALNNDDEHQDSKDDVREHLRPFAEECLAYLLDDFIYALPERFKDPDIEEEREDKVYDELVNF